LLFTDGRGRTRRRSTNSTAGGEQCAAIAKAMASGGGIF
jgi:hypothetical protein